MIELIEELKAKKLRQEGEFAGRRSELDKIITILQRKRSKEVFLRILTKEEGQERRHDATPVGSALLAVHREILSLAEENDQHGMGEVLTGNTYKENTYRGTAAGLRMAADVVLRELQRERAS